MSAEPTLGISITASDLTKTGQHSEQTGHHQYRIGSTTFIYFTPEIAKQWIAELETTAEGNK